MSPSMRGTISTARPSLRPGVGWRPPSGPAPPATLHTSADPGKRADLAMESLKKAIAAGYKDLGVIKKDSDLDALRGREDFKKLGADLEKQAEKKSQ